VATLVEQPPGPLRQRLSLEASERFRRAESAARAADQQDPRQVPVRHGSVYTLREPPRTKPQSVMPRSAARSTARLDGAPTATSTGQPATAAFWASSNESRPLTHSRGSERGSSCAGRAQPTTLSIGLCRPTSSRTPRASPAREKSPVACNPPVTSNAACPSRSRSGNEATRFGDSRSSDRTRGASTATASSAPFPHTPHEEEV